MNAAAMTHLHIDAYMADASDFKVKLVDFGANGVFGGGTVGYNLNLAPFVIGVEGDLGYLDLSGAGRIPSSNPAAHQDITLDGGLYGVVAARAGVLVTPATLVYGKGGFAFYDGEARQQTTNPGYVTHGTSTFTGWAAGGGVEHFITQNVSLKVEYLHFDFGDQAGNQTSVSDDPIGYVYKNRTKLDADSVKLGIAYHF